MGMCFKVMQQQFLPIIFFTSCDTRHTQKYVIRQRHNDKFVQHKCIERERWRYLTKLLRAISTMNTIHFKSAVAIETVFI